MYTFFKAMGLNIGKSILEDDKIELAKEVLNKAKLNKEFLLPVDFVIADKFENTANKKTIEFDKMGDESSFINLVWDKTEVPIKVEVDYVDKLVSQIEAVMASDEKKKPYFQSALFYYNHGKDLQKAGKWVDAAIAERDAHYMVYLKAEILAKQGDKAGALAAAKHSTELAEKANDAAYVRMNAELIKSLK